MSAPMWLPCCPSTNDVAWEEGRRSGRDFFAVAADVQTAGRGRRERSWVSPEGKDLLFSVYLCPPRPLEPAGVITAIGAVAVCEALADSELGTRYSELHIRWPNDLYVGPRKICGILAESRTDRGTPDYVLGIGLNVNSSEADWPQEIRAQATSLLRETGRPWDRRRLLDRIVDRLGLRHEDLLAGRLRRLLEAWNAHSRLAGKRVRLHIGDGRIEGMVESADFAEGITLGLPDGSRRTFRAEHVTRVEPLF